MLNHHDRGLTLGHLFEIQKQSALEESGVPEPVSELTNRVMMVTKLIVGLEGTEAGITVFEDVDSNKKRAAATGQRMMRLLAGYEETSKEKKCWIRHLQGPVHRHLCC